LRLLNSFGGGLTNMPSEDKHTCRTKKAAQLFHFDLKNRF